MKHLIPEIEITSIDNIHNNINNPREIKTKKFLKLIESIKRFPEMLYIRPIVIDTHGTILGGNMRYEACKEIGYKEVPIIKAVKLTEKQKKEFIIKDNLTSGVWDTDKIANEWDIEELKEWDLELKEFKEELKTDIDKDENNDSSNMDDKNILKFNLSYNDYLLAKGKLQELSDNLEDALMILINRS